MGPPTHDGGQGDGEAQSQAHLAGHAVPLLRLTEEDDRREEGHDQREDEREAQQSVIGLHHRSVDVEEKHHLEKTSNITDTNVEVGQIHDTATPSLVFIYCM